MSSLRVGIANYEEMKARTLAIARGQHKPTADEPKVWFTSLESIAKVLSTGNRELLSIIGSRHPRSIQELADITGRQKSNLSRTLKTMERYGIVRLDRGKDGRITPSVTHDRVAVEFLLTKS
jgi:predicted transcriptional regulator